MLCVTTDTGKAGKSDHLELRITYLLLACYQYYCIMLLLKLNCTEIVVYILYILYYIDLSFSSNSAFLNMFTRKQWKCFSLQTSGLPFSFLLQALCCNHILLQLLLSAEFYIKYWILYWILPDLSVFLQLFCIPVCLWGIAYFIHGFELLVTVLFLDETILVDYFAFL